LPEAAHAIAIVGSRASTSEAEGFAYALAGALVRAGAVVVSGGAQGIDAAAHRGALDARGRTWAVAGTGCEHCFPPEHASLFEAIARGPGAMIWPFSPDSAARPGAFVLRNRVLVALSDAVVVAQAGSNSGALRAAACARALRKPLWAVPAPPWAIGFEGSRQLLAEGVRPLTSIDAFVLALEMTKGLRRESSPEVEACAPEGLDPIQSKVLRATSSSPLHVERIAEQAHVTLQAAAAALLTLALEAVLVEGPPGFFRRPDSYKR